MPSSTLITAILYILESLILVYRVYNWSIKSFNKSKKEGAFLPPYTGCLVATEMFYYPDVCLQGAKWFHPLLHHMNCIPLPQYHTVTVSLFLCLT